MLRYLVMMNELGIRQMELRDVTGYSKSMISRILRHGDMPKKLDDLEAVKTAMANFAAARNDCLGWCRERGCGIEGLFDVVQGSGFRVQGSEPERMALDRIGSVPLLDMEILSLVGRGLMFDDVNLDDLACLGRCTIYLLEQIRQQPLSMDAQAELEMRARDILNGGPYGC